MFKKILLLILFSGGFIFAFSYFNNKKVYENVVVPIVENPKPETITLCFYKESPANERGFSDVSWLKMNLTGDKVTGEFRNLPAEKDSKIGIFEGSVGAVDKYAMARTADVWWNSIAEGMSVKEQLRIIFGEGTAQAGFAEMVDRGDGVYVYKDIENIEYWQEMTDVSCEDLDDRIFVEKYVRENIKTLAPEDPVLGGSWYVLKIKVNYLDKTGTMSYEDGHIQGNATFSYTRNGENVLITNIKKI